MPIREYSCSQCNEIFEEYESMNADPLEDCKYCEGGKVMRIMSLTARPVVPGDPRDAVLAAKAEGKAMAREILKGNQEVIADVYGDDVASGKPMKAQPKPKTLDQVTNGKIKRST